MGLIYLYGYGVKEDYYKALKLFTLAAEQGLADAQLHLGQIYFKGLLENNTIFLNYKRLFLLI